MLLTGGSGIALGLPRNFARRGLLRRTADAFPAVAGPGVVLSGSCSIASRAQVAAYAARHPALAVDAGALLEGEVTVDEVADFVAANRAAAPIVYSTATPETVAAVQARHGRERVSDAVETFFAKLAPRLVADGARRIVVGGGETSGAVVSALGLAAFRVGREIDPGVPVLATNGDPVLGLALKSGNFGGTDFFERALEAMEAP